MNVSSLFPQYLINAMFIGVLAVIINTHFSASPPIFCDQRKLWIKDLRAIEIGRGLEVWQMNMVLHGLLCTRCRAYLYGGLDGTPHCWLELISSKRSVGLLKIWMKYSIDMDPFWQMLTSFEFYILATIVFVIRTHGHYSFILLELATGHFWSK